MAFGTFQERSRCIDIVWLVHRRASKCGGVMMWLVRAKNQVFRTRSSRSGQFHVFGGKFIGGAARLARPIGQIVRRGSLPRNSHGRGDVRVPRKYRCSFRVLPGEKCPGRRGTGPTQPRECVANTLPEMKSGNSIVKTVACWGSNSYR